MYVQLFIFQEVFQSGRAGSAHTIKILLLLTLQICTTGQTSYAQSWDIKSLDLELQLTASPKLLGEMNISPAGMLTGEVSGSGFSSPCCQESSSPDSFCAAQTLPSCSESEESGKGRVVAFFFFFHLLPYHKNRTPLSANPSARDTALFSLTGGNYLIRRSWPGPAPLAVQAASARSWEPQARPALTPPQQHYPRRNWRVETGNAPPCLHLGSAIPPPPPALCNCGDCAWGVCGPELCSGHLVPIREPSVPAGWHPPARRHRGAEGRQGDGSDLLKFLN